MTESDSNNSDEILVAVRFKSSCENKQ